MHFFVFLYAYRYAETSQHLSDAGNVTDAGIYVGVYYISLVVCL